MVKPRRFELRMSLLFAAVFAPVGIHLPYFPLWLDHIGFGAREIAVILSAPLFLRVLTTMPITMLADRSRDRADMLVAVVAATFLLSFGYFLTRDYATVLFVSLALAVVWPPMTPLADSLALSGVRRFGADYSRLRVWGSAAFLVANFGGGIILSVAGVGMVPVMISAGLAATLLAALAAPRLGRPRRPSQLSAAGLQHAAPSLLTPGFLLFVTGAGMVNASHSFLYGFGSIYWSSLGIGEGLIGLLWSWALVAEVGMFALFTRLFGRVSPTRLLVFAGLAAMVRWIAFPFIWPGGLGVSGFFVTQTLHAFSTGLFLIGVQKMIAETVPDHRTGAAQGIAFIANGISVATVMFVSGPLYEMAGAGGFHAMAAVAAGGVVLLLVGGLQPHRPEAGGDTSEPS